MGSSSWSPTPTRRRSQQSKSQSRIQMGVKVTEGLGAGARASVGAAAAEESIEQIVDHLAGAHMCFITAGMGGGTGTGAAPIIAQAARELGVLTVGVVTKPFQFEGAKRMRLAEEGVEALQRMVDTLIIIPNQNLFRLANEKTTFTDAFSMADDVLYQGVKGVTDLMVRPGLINLDFADVRAVMDEMGKAMMGTGEAGGDERAIQAAEKAIANPLLDEISLRGAKGVLINITGGYDLTLFELDEAANRIREEVDPDANIIVGSTLDPDMEGLMRVSVVATGIDANEGAAEMPVPRRSMARPLDQQVRAEEPARASAPSAPPAPVQQAARAAAPEPRREPEEEPSLFNSFEPSRAGGEEPLEMLDEDEMATPRFRHDPAAHRTETPSYPAAQQAPRQAGAPSPEAMQRLQAAVRKTPAAEARAVRAPEPVQDKPRFGINSLINRMTGQPAEAPARPQAAPRQQPQVRHQAEPEPMSPEQEKIEIPAFLRRQAN
jgi:cell division protein FtsZ